MIGERLHRARMASGLSLRALSDQLSISHTAINKFEKNLLIPSSKQIINFSKVLNVRTEYFFRPIDIEIKGIEYRKKSHIPKKILNKITSDVYDQVERWEDLLQLFPQRPILPFSPIKLSHKVTNLDEVEKISENLRHTWELGLNPITDLVEMLESKGILVISSSIDSEQKFDGLTGMVNDKPIIVVSEHWSGDRQRFTLAHELGHLILEESLDESIDEEAACNRFSGAFLLPKVALIEALGEHRSKLDINELHMLKQEFGLSMLGLVFRALNCGIISKALHQSIFKSFSSKGWIRKEPGKQYPLEKTLLFPRLIYRALAEDYLSEAKAAELLSISIRKFRQQSQLEELNEGSYQ
jgi:Zn-dependent peptidase ImmA (M78 family)/DNA-binding XRE family transcriptional regulator